MSFRPVTDFLRHWPLHILTALLFGSVLILAPQQAGLFIYKGALIFGAAIAAYWVNRIMFKRPSDDGEKTQHNILPTDTTHADWQLCAMVCFAMLSVGLAA